MFAFTKFGAVRNAAIILAGLIVTGCDYSPPSIGAAGAGGTGGDGGMGGNQASSSSGSSSSGSSSSSSGMPGVERCTNDLDDDMNGTADCADPACGAYKCTPSVPPGDIWSGPFLANIVEYDAIEPACPDDKIAFRKYGVGASMPACKQCQCEVTGAICAGAKVHCYNNLSCFTGQGWGEHLVNGCMSIGSASTCSPVEPQKINGTPQCSPLGGGGLIQPNPFAKKVLRCDTPINAGTGCEADEVCGLVATADYPRTCIAAAGAQACPPGWGNIGIGYEFWNDTRSCAPCACDPNGAYCPNNDIFTTYTNNTCDGTGDGVGFGQCVSMAGVLSVNSVPKAPSLPPTNCMAAPGGAVERTGDTTFCCLPPQ